MRKPVEGEVEVAGSEARQGGPARRRPARRTAPPIVRRRIHTYLALRQSARQSAKKRGSLCSIWRPQICRLCGRGSSLLAARAVKRSSRPRTMNRTGTRAWQTAQSGDGRSGHNGYKEDKRGRGRRERDEVVSGRYRRVERGPRPGSSRMRCLDESRRVSSTRAESRSSAMKGQEIGEWWVRQYRGRELRLGTVRPQRLAVALKRHGSTSQRGCFPKLGASQKRERNSQMPYVSKMTDESGRPRMLPRFLRF
jgi:hypothetical protein